MSFDLQKMIWDDPEPRGQSKTVLLHLASYVKQEAWNRGGDLLAWPSQRTIAAKCCIPRSSVERALSTLVELGKIRDTGRRRQRQTIVWELYPSSAPNIATGLEAAADWPDSRAGQKGDWPDGEAGQRRDVPDGGASGEDMPDSRASADGTSADWPDSGHDWPDPADDWPDSRAGSGPTVGYKREVERRTTNREQREKARAGARDPDPESDLSEELAEVETLLAKRPADKLLSGRRDELSALTDAEGAASCQ